jgi:mono/diheme cytochrome c family protein
MCHGPDGKMNASGAADLSVSQMNIEQRIEIIKNGKGIMFSFQAQLSEEQIKAVAAYLDELKK